MSLESRIKAFDRLSSRFACERQSPLISAYGIGKQNWEHLRIATMLYMSKCLPGEPIILDEEELLNRFEWTQNKMRNITPNGMIVPKRHLILEYNLLVRAFMDIMQEMDIGDFVASWHIPLNLRFKASQVVKDNLKRQHATELIHTDAWAGESPASVAVYISILGDVERNRIVFYDPPPDFSEDWLRPLQAYRDGAPIAKRYKKTKIKQKQGHVYLADFATMHASTRFRGSGSRVSFDTTFTLKRSVEESQMAEEKMHPWRKGERADYRTLCEIGKTKMFVFLDSMDVIRRGHFIHPTKLEIQELLPTK